MTKFREIKPTDNPILANIIREIFHEYDAPQQGTVYSDPTTDDLFALFHADKAVLWVAEEGENILGCCGIYPTQGLPSTCAELVKFYLVKESRGKGIGKALMKKSIESAQSFGYSEIYLESLPEFDKAVGIYENQGFVTLDKPMGDSGHTTCTVWMVKRL